MTPLAELVHEMMQRGMPMDMIARTVEAFELSLATTRTSGGSPVDEAAEKRRAYDRDRKQRERDEKRKSGGSPVEVRGSSEGALTLSSLPIEEGSSKKEGKKERARKHLLSADWRPSEVHFEAAAKLGVSREAVLSKAEDMRIWAGSNGSLKKDWDLTFHGFLRRDAPRRSGQQFTNGKPNGPTAPNGLAAALGKLRENIGQPSGSETGGGPPPRLLSHG